MHLVQVVEDEAKMVAGYEQHTFECSGCHEVEHRAVVREGKKRPVLSSDRQPDFNALLSAFPEQCKQLLSFHIDAFDAIISFDIEGFEVLMLQWSAGNVSLGISRMSSPWMHVAKVMYTT